MGSVFNWAVNCFCLSPSDLVKFGLLIGSVIAIPVEPSQAREKATGFVEHNDWAYKVVVLFSAGSTWARAPSNFTFQTQFYSFYLSR